MDKENVSHFANIAQILSVIIGIIFFAITCSNKEEINTLIKSQETLHSLSIKQGYLIEKADSSIFQLTIQTKQLQELYGQQKESNNKLQTEIGYLEHQTHILSDQLKISEIKKRNEDMGALNELEQGVENITVIHLPFFNLGPTRENDSLQIESGINLLINLIGPLLKNKYVVEDSVFSKSFIDARDKLNIMMTDLRWQPENDDDEKNKRWMLNDAKTKLESFFLNLRNKVFAMTRHYPRKWMPGLD